MGTALFKKIKVVLTLACFNLSFVVLCITSIVIYIILIVASLALIRDCSSVQGVVLYTCVKLCISPSGFGLSESVMFTCTVFQNTFFRFVFAFSSACCYYFFLTTIPNLCTFDQKISFLLFHCIKCRRDLCDDWSHGQSGPATAGRCRLGVVMASGICSRVNGSSTTSQSGPAKIY